ncbi:MAG: YgiQ family radical SAM protein [Chloroflexi bacterium]|nr:YgiQ family radical SAM protein [Chloroflexota bacterium]
MFLPTTWEEVKRLGWDALDIILVTGDSYIDSPFIGTAVIGKVLLNAGYRVGVIAQPDPKTDADIGRLGEPRLFWGVSAGSVDSMVANYTALKKPRRSDDYTPGGENTRRPDRATIVYANIIRRFTKRAHTLTTENTESTEKHLENSVNSVRLSSPKGTVVKTPPIVLGGIEASLRRVAHYDFWDNAIRRSVLFDAKADYILYGMAENPVLELAAALRDGADPRAVRGLCYIAKEPREGYLELPPYETVAADKLAFIGMFHTFYRNNDPVSARGLTQKHADRYLVQNPPASHQTQAELDAVYALGFERAQHPYYEAQGKVRALETIGFSVSTHRGCYGECSFCAIAVHEGTTVRWRSPESILAEAEGLTQHPAFKGYISDLGGPTANMYGFECRKKLAKGICTDKRCVYPEVCPAMKVNHQPQIDLLRKVRSLPGVKKVFVASGLRYDMILSDQACGDAYLREIVEHHVSGQLKIAPEHTEAHVLDAMGKPGPQALLQFKQKFDALSRQAGKPQFLTYYMIAAHPGCSTGDMMKLKKFTSEKLHINPEQVQIFTPTPSTYDSLMYHTEPDPFTLHPIFVEKDPKRKEHQKDIVTRKPSTEFS